MVDSLRAVEAKGWKRCFKCYVHFALASPGYDVHNVVASRSSTGRFLIMNVVAHICPDLNASSLFRMIEGALCNNGFCRKTASWENHKFAIRSRAVVGAVQED